MSILSDFVTGFTGSCRRRFVPRASAYVKKSTQGHVSATRTVVLALVLALAVLTGIGWLIRSGHVRYRRGVVQVGETKITVLPNALVDPPAVTAENLDEVLSFEPGVTPRKWTSIVLHHSATAGGSAESFGAYHREHHGWRSLGYHFVIGNGKDMGDGTVAAGPRWSRQEAGAHANSNSYNQYGIGICLVGNFEFERPTEAQLTALKALVRELAKRSQLAPERILGHGEIRQGGGTACPGRLFPLAEVRDAARTF